MGLPEPVLQQELARTARLTKAVAEDRIREVSGYTHIVSQPRQRRKSSRTDREPTVKYHGSPQDKEILPSLPIPSTLRLQYQVGKFLVRGRRRVQDQVRDICGVSAATIKPPARMINIFLFIADSFTPMHWPLSIQQRAN